MYKGFFSNQRVVRRLNRKRFTRYSKKNAKNKPPGNDGLTKKFYETFGMNLRKSV